MARKWPSILVAILLGAIAVARIVSTYPVFSPTFDEPAHLAGGIELLALGTSSYERKHPPLARLAVAVGPYLAGARPHGDRNLFAEGNRILHAAQSYPRTLALARLGTLPFFLLLVAVVGIWAWRDFGAGAGLAAVLLVTTSPPILGHAGLATNDIAAAATVALCLLVLIEWIDHPNDARSAALGVAAALALTSKLSAAFYLPPCAVVLAALAMARPARHGTRSSSGWLVMKPRHFLLGAAAFFATTWAVYGFSSDPMFPLSELWRGFDEVRGHNAGGHPAYFLGEVRWTGWWHFYPIALALKSPLPLLLLCACGAVFLQRAASNWRDWAPLACAAAVLLVAVLSRINTGTRHVLVVYAMLSILGGLALARLWQSASWPNAGRVAAAALIAWQIAVSAAAHPDYLAYFNPLAGSEPGRLIADSDLDWGQDIDRLASALRAYDVPQIWVSLHTLADLSRHGLPPYQVLPPHQPVTGWIAISWTRFATGCAQPPFDWFCWLTAHQPVASVGKTIRLYRIPALEQPR